LTALQATGTSVLNLQENKEWANFNTHNCRQRTTMLNVTGLLQANMNVIAEGQTDDWMRIIKTDQQQLLLVAWKISANQQQ